MRTFARSPRRSPLARLRCSLLLSLVVGLAACDRPAPSPAPEAGKSSAPTTPTPGQSASPSAASIDPGAVEKATGIKPEVADAVVKVSYPRSDVKVEVDGWSMPPFMGLTSWVTFVPGEKPGVEAMVMGGKEIQRLSSDHDRPARE